LVVGEERGCETLYRLLETLRRFALDRLEETGKLAGRRRRHGLFFLQMAETAEPDLYGSEQIVYN
jgi:predicted ATPase